MDIKKEVEKIYESISKLEEKINNIGEEKELNTLKILTERIDEIEDFLIMRTRGFYLRYKQK